MTISFRYKEKESTGMAIMDIGILTGFKLGEKSQQKVSCCLMII